MTNKTKSIDDVIDCLESGGKAWYSTCGGFGHPLKLVDGRWLKLANGAPIPLSRLTSFICEIAD